MKFPTISRSPAPISPAIAGAGNLLDESARTDTRSNFRGWVVQAPRTDRGGSWLHVGLAVVGAALLSAVEQLRALLDAVQK